RADVAFVRGEGPYLFAEDGQRYLDFGAGVAVNALGHANPKLVAALMEQAQKVWHTSNNYRITGQEKLSKQLVESTFADTMFFTNSGAESIECAIKMARRYHFANGHRGGRSGEISRRFRPEGRRFRSGAVRRSESARSRDHTGHGRAVDRTDPGRRGLASRRSRIPAELAQDLRRPWPASDL